MTQDMDLSERCRVHCNEPSVCIKGTKCVEYMSDSLLLKGDSAPWNWLLA
jgi:hypothetical protein